MRRAATTGKSKPSTSSSSKRPEPVSRSNSAPHPQASSNEPHGRIKSRPVCSDSDTGSDGLRKFAASLAMAKDIEHERRYREANRGKARPKAFKPIRRRVDDDDEEDEPSAETLKALKWRPTQGRPPEHMSRTVAAQQRKVNPLIKALGIKIRIIRSDDEFDTELEDDDERSPSPLPSTSAPSLSQTHVPAPKSPSASDAKVTLKQEKGSLASELSDTDYGSDHPAQPAAAPSHKPLIESENLEEDLASELSDTDYGSDHPAQPTAARSHEPLIESETLEEDLASELSDTDYGSDHPAQPTAAPSHKPLIESENLEEALASELSDTDYGSDHPAQPAAAPSHKPLIESENLEEDLASELSDTDYGSDHPPQPAAAPSHKPLIESENLEEDLASELSDTDYGSDHPAKPAAAPSHKPLIESKNLEEDLASELSDTDYGSDHWERPAPPSHVSPLPSRSSEQLQAADTSLASTLSTTEDESDHGARATAGHLSPFKSRPADKSQEADISLASELSTTESEGYSKHQKAVLNSDAMDEDLLSTDCQGKRGLAGKTNDVSSHVSHAAGPGIVKRKLSDHGTRKRPTKKAKVDVAPIAKTYPRVQSEARPHFEITDAVQDEIGPLILDNTCQLTASINRFLKPYQRDGVKFFFKHFCAKNGVILGDDMGLGKTIQVIAFLSAVMGLKGIPDEEGRRKQAINRSASNRVFKPTELGPTCLVICPNSIIDNWAREIETWGYMEYATLSSKTQNPRETLKRFNSGAYDILICGFTHARDHIDELYDLDFTVLVVDEVHKLKNPKSRLTSAFHRFKTKIRIGLTGTALQNNLFELHSLFDWARPGCLGTLAMWQAFVSDPILQSRKLTASSYEKQLGEARAKALVNNYWPDLQLRRTKTEILHELPARTDKIALCPMTATQKRAYKNLSSDPDVANMRKHAEPCSCGKKNKKGQRYPSGLCCDQGWVKRIFPYITAFKKIANHVALAYPTKQDKREKYNQDKEFIQKMFPEDYKKREYHAFCEYNTELCGKWLVLKPLLFQWKREGSKVLIFSQWTKMMDILGFWFEQDSLSYVRLDGKVPIHERLARVDEFQNNEENFIFLASTSAAGVGLNLTAANRVVIFDPSWNPSNDAQAMDRVVRIGQKREVECIRLISRGTAEELIYHRQVYKAHLAEVANTGNAPSRHFKGVQGDKKNQGEIFGVRNIFKNLSERAGSQPEERGEELAYALSQLMEHAGSEQDVQEEAEEFVLEEMKLEPEASQPNPNSTEALLHACGVDLILNHGDVVKEPSGSGRALERNLTPRGIGGRRKDTRGPPVVTEIPLRGALKAKAQQGAKKDKQPEAQKVAKKSKEPIARPVANKDTEPEVQQVAKKDNKSELTESSLDTDEDDVRTLQKICDLECGRAVNLDKVLKVSRSKTKVELAKAYQSWKPAKRKTFLQQIKKTHF